MKAVTLKIGDQVNTLEDRLDYPVPSLKKDKQLLIKIKAAAVNPIDLQMFQGKNEIKILKSDILGREAAGVVEEVGSAVTQFKVGDEVYLAVSSLGSNGSFAEYVVVDEEITALKPPNLDFKQATTLPVSYLTAWQVISRLDIPKSATIFLMGASGSVGKALINVLHHRGYKYIVATAGNAASVSHLKKQNIKAEHIIDYKMNNLLDHLLAITDGKYYDLVIDCIGDEMTEIGATVLKREGLYIDVTNMKTTEAADILFTKAANLMNISRYAEPELYYKYGSTLNQVSEIIKETNWHFQEYIDLGNLSAANVYKAFDMLKHNETIGKKIVFSIA